MNLYVPQGNTALHERVEYLRSSIYVCRILRDVELTFRGWQQVILFSRRCLVLCYIRVSDTYRAQTATFLFGD